MAKTTYRFPAADVLAAKAVMSALHETLVKKAAENDKPIFDLHLVFNIGKIAAAPKKEVMANLTADPMAYLLIEPPGGITYAALDDLLFGAPRAKQVEELMGFTLLMLQMIRRVGLAKGPSLMTFTEDTFLRPLLGLVMAYTNELVPQEITHVVEYNTRKR